MVVVIHSTEVKDFNQNIVWENVDGRIAAWLMNGVTVTSGAEIVGAGLGWTVTGD